MVKRLPCKEGLRVQFRVWSLVKYSNGINRSIPLTTIRIMKSCIDNKNWQSAQTQTRLHQVRTKSSNVEIYLKSPVLCATCGTILPYNKRHGKYCTKSCAAKTNNVKFPKKNKATNIIGGKKGFQKTIVPTEHKCIGCSNVYVSSTPRKYCTSGCGSKHRKRTKFSYIKEQQKASSSKQGRDYLIDVHGAKCFLCGWNSVNEKTGVCPIELDHIDGNSDNNHLLNLRLLCPNCHSLQPTHKALNIGNGRHNRRKRYYEQKSY
jgi:hypothetical protein